jgi:mannose-6-phosphate isomerase-like protein (cupin superfamily)
MVNGWFIGDFEPSLYPTQNVEVAVKHYSAGDHEGRHHHKFATELTAIVSGTARMGDREVGPGDIVVLEPGEASDFTALTDVALVAVKLPAVKDDKYPDDD